MTSSTQDPLPAESAAPPGWRGVNMSAAALGVALIGDALLYVVLPVNAAAFGVSIAWVGVLLSVNRFVRIFAYGLIVSFAERVGPRRLCILAAVATVVSTGMYGFLQGAPALLAARVLWGVCYASLLLVTLGYAVQSSARAGTRVGVSYAIQQVGPVLALTGGAWLAGTLGPQEAFVVLAGISLLAVPFALALPKPAAETAAPAAAPPGRRLSFPNRLEGLFLTVGIGVDGVFAVTIAIILASEISVAGAMLSAGLILALRYVGEVVFAPLAGAVADRYGTRLGLLVFTATLAAGFVATASGFTYAGALAIVVARGALAALGPAAIAQSMNGNPLRSIARLQAWRDVGAALGPLATGFAIVYVSPLAVHAATAVCLLLVLGVLALPQKPSQRD